MQGGHRVLVASGNMGKVREFAEMLAPLGWDCATLTEFPGVAEPEETGRTFRANSCLKASYYARATGMVTLADDSGLEVDALGGKPGVLSARWAREHGRPPLPGLEGRQGHDAANSELLLEQLAEVPEGERGARFVCVLAVSDPAGRILYTTRGTVEGRILREPRGSGGFGYDPLFLVESHGSVGKTTAEMSAAEKHAISHRGAALRELVSMMKSAADRQ